MSENSELLKEIDLLIIDPPYKNINLIKIPDLDSLYPNAIVDFYGSENGGLSEFGLQAGIQNISMGFQENFSLFEKSLDFEKILLSRLNKLSKDGLPKGHTIEEIIDRLGIEPKNNC